MKTLVIGASTDESRYANKAIKSLVLHGHQVVAIGKKSGVVSGINIDTHNAPYQNVDTVTLYINPSHQAVLYDYIFSLKPRRIIFNPGTENDELEMLAEKKGIVTERACTLVLLSINAY
ncbi:MAG: CoA-binding protein [Bacteroidia bacterium]|nr:CoA-binding protein [Bacteroidia bacterium]